MTCHMRWLSPYMTVVKIWFLFYKTIILFGKTIIFYLGI